MTLRRKLWAAAAISSLAAPGAQGVRVAAGRQVRAVRPQTVGREAGKSREISPGDAMYIGNDHHYFAVAESAGRAIGLALQVAGFARPRAILDYGCGHGRVLRLLRYRYPEAAITACDVTREGVDFWASIFGAIPLYGSTRPEEMNVGGPFDLVWSGSLLTHHDQDQWDSMLALWTGSLAEGGVLVFTTHGRRADHLLMHNDIYGLDPAADCHLLTSYRTNGFGYVDYSTQDWYQGESGYGVSLSSPAWVPG